MPENKKIVWKLAPNIEFVMKRSERPKVAYLVGKRLEQILPAKKKPEGDKQ